MSAKARSVESHLQPAERELIAEAVTSGAKRYFDSRRGRIPDFVQTHFSLKGALRINRRALGGDLLRAPANLMWAAPYLGLRVSSLVLRKAGVKRLGERLGRVPPGFQTRVQREVQWLVQTELLELPWEQDGRRAEADALLAAILAEPALSALLVNYLERIHEEALRPGFEQALRRDLGAYGGARLAAADLACGVISLSAGAAAFKQLTPGALSTGSALAAAIAQHSAISGFVFGPTLGSVYYGVFPAAASAGLIAASTGGVLAALGVVSAFSGVITDPVQARLGLHQRRLGKLIDALEAGFASPDAEGFRPRDHYAARIFDFFDLLKSAATLR